MSINEIAAAVATIREYTRIKEEAEALISAAQDAIKAHMTDAKTDEISGNDYRITWKTVNGSKLDQKALEAAYPGLIATFTRPNPYRRFLLK